MHSKPAFMVLPTAQETLGTVFYTLCSALGCSRRKLLLVPEERVSIGRQASAVLVMQERDAVQQRATAAANAAEQQLEAVRTTLQARAVAAEEEAATLRAQLLAADKTTTDAWAAASSSGACLCRFLCSLSSQSNRTCACHACA